MSRIVISFEWIAAPDFEGTSDWNSVGSGQQFEGGAFEAFGRLFVVFHIYLHTRHVF